MSATTELLLEQIKLTEETLAVAKSDGRPESAVIVSQCESNLKTLRAALASAAEALTEGKQILKG
jgi:hypothetical protein